MHLISLPEKISLLRSSLLSAVVLPAFLCMAILFVIAFSSPAYAYDISELGVTRSIANVRAKPSMDAPVAWVLSPDRSFRIKDEPNGWYSVYPAAAADNAAPVGYIARKIVYAAETGTQPVDWGDVRYVGQNLKYHLKRNAGSPSGGTIKSGDRIKVGFLRNGWYAIFKGDAPVASEAEALGYVKQSSVDLDVEDARIRYAVRRINVTEKSLATSKDVGILSAGHRAQVGREHAGMYALYRIDTIVKKDTPVWGYAWGPFLAPYPKNLEKQQMAGIDARKAELAAEDKKKAAGAKKTG